MMASLSMYYLGLWISEKRSRWLVKRVERFKLLFRLDLDKAREPFDRDEGRTVLLGQLLPGVGAWISLPVGIKRMPVRWRITVYGHLGSAS